ncbi:proton-conducting transporter transmembrane domain-containing protein [Nannocystis radixulma]|uniref:Proton-conducting transporter membrane subunit n=1 Tax=Nannocystis radixulma TaxID=2995305 RepID=A0ABT5BG34_9BACT|nr:proton-conducting transporter membrane subunit [Nannocystis radixulma]MDC0673111.1 proton-conducting transporter membrane subunit [Nannocystis radixulma]
MSAWVQYSLIFLWLAPLLAAAALRWGVRGATKQRALALSFAVPIFVMACALFVHESTGREYAVDHLEQGSGWLHSHFAVDGLNAVLLPLTAALTLVVLLMTPRAEMRAGLAAKIMVVEGALMGCFLALDAGLLSIFVVLSLLPLWFDARSRGSRPLQVIMKSLVVATTLALAVAMIGLAFEASAAGLAYPLDLVALTNSSYTPSPWIGALVLCVALLRMGIVPLHLWIPAAAQHSTAHLALVTCLTPVGSFMLARLALAIFPRVLGPAAPLLMIVGTFTAVYGAFLALGQFDLRRIVAWFWVSQSGLVLAGFAGLDDASVSGALLQAMSTVVECGGLMLLTLAVEVRANTTDLRKLGGLAHNAPRMATAYLILAAAAVGFPGTISFVAEDLVGQGLLREHPFVVGILFIVTAVNGITLWRAFKRTFLGPPSPHADDLRGFEDLRRWEAYAIAGMIGTLLLGGFLPEPLLAVRRGVVDAIQRVEAPGQVDGSSDLH